MSERRVLITGAGGFVGRALATGFADLGWDVIGLDRAFDERPEDPRVRRVVADLEECVPDGVPEVDLVVHAAWVTTDPQALGITLEEYRGRTLLPLATMLRFALVAGPADFVFLSSSGVFAPGDATEGLTDTQEPTGDSPYAKTKRDGEGMVAAALADDTGAVHVVRLGYLFGPHEVARPTRQGVSLVARWITAARAGQPLEVRADDPVREWTFAPDLARALERVVEGPPAGRPVHLGSPRVMRDSQVAALIAADVPGAKIVTVPAVGPVKPPMVPSDIAALRDFVWTDVPDGLRVLATADGTDGFGLAARERSA